MKISRVKIPITIFIVAVFLVIAISPVIGSADETVRIWVNYAPNRKSEVAQALNRVNATFHYDFPELDAYVVTLPAAAIEGILRNPFVVGIEEDVPRYLIEPVSTEIEPLSDYGVQQNGQIVPYGIDMVQARDVWDSNNDGEIDDGAPTGEGITVCVIDTGYWNEHEDLVDDVDGVSQISGEEFLEDEHGHGTHVSGTIGAIHNNIGVVGVSPGTVGYYIVKIFNNDGVWVPGSSDLVAAVNECAENGAKVINMSLGGSSRSRNEEQAFNNWYEKGVLHVASAGNAGNNQQSFPASYSSVISVAAIDENKVVADFSQQNNQVELSAPGVRVLSTVPFIDESYLEVAETQYSANHIYNSARGNASGNLVYGGLCNSTGSWNGMVVLCQRGEISFYDKVRNVENSGGAAAVIYNNEPGNFYGTLGDNTSEIIALSISQEDGEYLVANKLDVFTEVSSTFTQPDSGYEAWSGTSMAAPHVSGVAALVWSDNPGWSNTQIRTALQETAEVLGSSRAYGYGLVQAQAALDYLRGEEPPPPSEDQLLVSISTNKANYIDGETVVITIEVTSDSVSVEGASVTASVRGSRGRTISYSDTTNADGTVVFNYTINTRRTGTGTYTISASAAKAGYETSEAQKTFIVQ